MEALVPTRSLHWGRLRMAGRGPGLSAHQTHPDGAGAANASAVPPGAAAPPRAGSSSRVALIAASLAAITVIIHRTTLLRLRGDLGWRGNVASKCRILPPLPHDPRPLQSAPTL
jgi:hypothetical protein